MVLQFGTTNAPVVLQHYLDNASRETLDNVSIVYLDDILKTSNSEEEPVQHAAWVMRLL